MGGKTRNIAVQLKLNYVTHAPFSSTHLSRAYKSVPPRCFKQTFYRKGKRGMKASENAIGRGTSESGTQKRATSFELMQNKLINDVARFTSHVSQTC